VYPILGDVRIVNVDDLIDVHLAEEDLVLVEAGELLLEPTHCERGFPAYVMLQMPT